MIPIHGEQVLSAPRDPCVQGRETGASPAWMGPGQNITNFGVLFSLWALMVINGWGQFGGFGEQITSWEVIDVFALPQIHDFINMSMKASTEEGKGMEGI